MKRLRHILVAVVVTAIAVTVAAQSPTLELPEEVEMLKDYKIPAASIVKFGDVDGDGKPDFLVLTPSYSAYMYDNLGKELWHWEAPPQDARLRGEFEAPGSIWDFDHDGYAEVVHWRIVDGKEWRTAAPAQSSARFRGLRRPCRTSITIFGRRSRNSIPAMPITSWSSPIRAASSA